MFTNFRNCEGLVWGEGYINPPKGPPINEFWHRVKHRKCKTIGLHRLVEVS